MKSDTVFALVSRHNKIEALEMSADARYLIVNILLQEKYRIRRTFHDKMNDAL